MPGRTILILNFSGNLFRRWQNVSIYSINPFNEETLEVFEPLKDNQIEEALTGVARAFPLWAATPLEERCMLLRRLAGVLREGKEELAGVITREMGKLIGESRTEVEKCARVCEYYAEQAPAFLEPEVIATDAGKSYVAYQSLGTVLAVMPWNFPLWQVMRAVAPAMAAGNTMVLKHASNVPRCALEIEKLFVNAGFPENVFRSLLVPASTVAGIIGDSRIRAVTLTGSENAGRMVAETAGRYLKKTVLELGGSDAFIILDDADLDLAAKTAVMARYMNAGQSCIAAKRFILVDPIAAEFLERFRAGVEALVPGDPMDETTTIAPMARPDLREELHAQVSYSIGGGAVAVTGCKAPESPGAFYSPSILDKVAPGTRAWEEELFGPVASVIRARDEDEAVRIANSTSFGLGGSVCTRDTLRGERVALRMECGCAFVNGMVKSDPRLPFGGIKDSGYGRELSHHGLREFVNIKTVWIK